MVIEIEHLHKFYNGKSVIRDLSLNIDKSERLVILGPSGCGKTTLLRMIAGLVVPDRGYIKIDGNVVSKDSKIIVEPENREVGMIFQDLALWPHMTVYKNLEFGLKAKGIIREERESRIDEVIEKIRMREFKNAYPAELSGGQQQRIAIARSLVLKPKILLMDEPLAHLDPELRLVLQKEFLKLHEDFGITVCYVTHNRDEAYNLATRIIFIEHGEILKVTKPI
ncbi:MAG: ABC transporter ATP-binding protein [Nitrospirae bacterium]|nr:ABC transporter ATP-binding protein [Nitrospirota bacterium]